MNNNVIDINELLMLSDESCNAREELKTKLHKEAMDICANLEGQLNTAFKEAAKDGNDGFFGYVETPRNSSDSEMIQAFVDKFPTEAHGRAVLEEALVEFLKNKKLIVSQVQISMRHIPIKLKVTTEVSISLGVKWRNVPLEIIPEQTDMYIDRRYETPIRQFLPHFKI